MGHLDGWPVLFLELKKDGWHMICGWKLEVRSTKYESTEYAVREYGVCGTKVRSMKFGVGGTEYGSTEYEVRTICILLEYFVLHSTYSVLSYYVL